MFSKILQGTSNLFNKITGDKNLFRKIGNTARQIDNSIARIGSFLVPTVNQFIPGSGSLVQGFVDGAHKIRNNLEKAINAPIEEIRQPYA